IQHRQVQVRPHKFHYAVGLDDDIFRIPDLFTKLRHRLGEPALLRADPQGTNRSCHYKTRTIRLPRTVFLLADSPGMIVRGAVAFRTIGRAYAVAVLGYFCSRPVELWQGRDQPSHHAGLPYAPRMSAHNYDRHRKLSTALYISAHR